MSGISRGRRVKIHAWKDTGTDGGETFCGRAAALLPAISYWTTVDCRSRLKNRTRTFIAMDPGAPGGDHAVTCTFELVPNGTLNLVSYRTLAPKPPLGPTIKKFVKMFEHSAVKILPWQLAVLEKAMRRNETE